MLCLFRPGIQYWLFQTLTGLTGVTLYTIVSLIFVFAHPLVRKKAFNFFWLTHQVRSLPRGKTVTLYFMIPDMYRFFYVVSVFYHYTYSISPDI